MIISRLLFFAITVMVFFPAESFSQLNHPVVFVSRNQAQNGHLLFPEMGLLPGMGEFSRTTIVGGKLMKRSADGTVTTLIDSSMTFNGISLYDVQQPCVHWDGERIVFAGVEHPDSNWRIYEIKKDGTGFRKLTFTDRFINLSQFGPAAYKFEKYDDIDPVYLANGAIVFASTRYPSLDMMSGSNATNIYILDTTGSKMYRISTERNGAEKPTIDPLTGHIVFTRKWLNIDMPSNLTMNGLTRDVSQAVPGSDIANLWQVASMKHDADELILFAANPLSRITLSGYRPRLTSSGDLLAVFVPHLPMVLTGGSSGIMFVKRGLNNPYYITGVNPETPVYGGLPSDYGIRIAPYATDPVMLPDGKVLFSYAASVINQNYGLYTININGSGLTEVLNFNNTNELNAEVLLPRSKPPLPFIINDFDTNLLPPDISNPSSIYQSGVFRFDAMNIFSNAPVDFPIGDAPNITTNAVIRFFANFQRQDTEGKDHPILIEEVEVDLTGIIIQGDAPANVSMFEQVVDQDGNILVSTRGDIAHVTGFNYAPTGSGSKCVGCHAGHTLIEVAPTITQNQFTNVSTSAIVAQSSFYNNDSSYSGKNVVDRKARNIDPSVNWISNGVNDQYVELSWDRYIDVSELVIYNIIQNQKLGTNITVTDCRIKFYKDENLIHQINSTGVIDTSGTSVEINPWITVNKLRVEVISFTGNVFGANVAGLAEVETIARISLENVVGINNESEIAETFELKQNYPNPFNPLTKIPFVLPNPGFVSLKVFDITGREIETLVSGRMTSGSKEILFDASRFASGIYIYRIEFESQTSGNFSSSRKMVLLR